jgi:hypothetical protein
MHHKENPGRACQRAGAETNAQSAVSNPPRPTRQDGSYRIVITLLFGRSDAWRVALESGELLLARTRVPMPEAARALLALGVDPEAKVTMQRVGGPDCFKPVRIGFAAQWTVSEPDGRSVHLRRWRPGPDTAGECGGGGRFSASSASEVSDHPERLP